MSTIATTNLKHPSSAVNNMVLSSNGNVTAATKFIGAGLDHIITQSFTSVSSVNINNCFSSTYDNYRILIDISARTSAPYALRFRMRSAGSDSSSGYTWRITNNYGTSLVQENTTSATYMEIQAAGLGATTLDLLAPNIARPTKFFWHAMNLDGSTTNFSVGTAAHTTSSAYDGITVFSDSGTVTGNIRIYGYENT